MPTPGVDEKEREKNTALLSKQKLFRTSARYKKDTKDKTSMVCPDKFFWGDPVIQYFRERLETV